MKTLKAKESFEYFEDFNKMPAFETIKRVRAKIQNTEGRYPPTDQDVIEKRKNREEEVKRIVGERKEILIIDERTPIRGVEVKNTRGNKY